MAATSSKTRSGFYISVGCPGCGGELELDEDFFVLTCRYCESTLRITMPERPPAYLVRGRINQREARFSIDRFLREHGRPLTSSDIQFKWVYYPYWKVDAIVLKTRNRVDEIEHVTDTGDGSTATTVSKIKKTDVSLSPYLVTFAAGGVLDGVPGSLGLRAEYVRAQPYAAESVQDDYRPLPVILDWPDARQRAVAAAGSVGRIEAAEFGRNRTELFRPKGSIIYFPYCIAESFGGGVYRRWIVDGVAGRVVGTDDVLEDGEVVSEAPTVEFGQLGIDFHRCANCGHDLPPAQAYLYVCEHCQQITTIEPHPLLDEQPTVTPDLSGRADRMLPFWLLRMSPEIGARLRASTGGLGQAGLLAVPAFKVMNFEALYRLSRRMSTAIGKMEADNMIEPDTRFAPANVSPSEALVLARAIVSRELMKLSSSLELPAGVDGFDTISLRYIPFQPEHYFYVDAVLGAVTVEKNLVPA